MLVARAPQSLLDGFPVRNVARDRSDVHFERRVAMVRRAPRVRRLLAENPLPNVVQLRVVVVELLVPACESISGAPRRRRDVILEGDIHRGGARVVVAARESQEHQVRLPRKGTSIEESGVVGACAQINQ